MSSRIVWKEEKTRQWWVHVHCNIIVKCLKLSNLKLHDKMCTIHTRCKPFEMCWHRQLFCFQTPLVDSLSLPHIWFTYPRLSSQWSRYSPDCLQILFSPRLLLWLTKHWFWTGCTTCVLTRNPLTRLLYWGEQSAFTSTKFIKGQPSGTWG